MTKKVPIGSLRTPEEIRRSLLGLYGSLTSTDASVEVNGVSIDAIEAVNAQLAADLANAEIAITAAEAEILLKIPIGDAAADVNAHAVTIDGGKLTADSVTANEVAAGAITSNELAANSVIAGKILANTIVAGDIAANTITAAEISAGTITGVEMNATTSITVGTHASSKWIIDGTSSAATSAIRTANATSYGDVDGVWFGADGKISLKNKLSFDGTTLDVNGEIACEVFSMVNLADTVVAQFDRNTTAYSLGTHELSLGGVASSSANHGIFWGSGDIGLAVRDTSAGYGDIGSYLTLNTDTVYPHIKMQVDGLIGVDNDYGRVEIGNGAAGDTSISIATSAKTIALSSGADVAVFGWTGINLFTQAGDIDLYTATNVNVEAAAANFISTSGSPTITLGEWSNGYNYAAVETPSMVVLMGSSADVNSQGFIRTKGAGSLNLGTNDSNDLTIANGGNVGIGTTSPNALLDVSSATGVNPSTPTEIAISTSTNSTWVDGDVWGKLAFRSADTSGGAAAGDIAASISASQASTYGYTTDLNFATRGSAGLSTKMRIDAEGNVGIGTTSPGAELEVRGASNPEIRVVSSDASDPALYFGDSVDPVRAGFVFDTSANKLYFRGYNNSTRMTINDVGNVGIGTTGPVKPLNIVSGTSEIMRLQNTTSTTKGPYISLWHSTGRIGYIGFPNNDDLYLKNESAAGHIYMATANTTRMFVKSNGNIGIGTTVPVAKLDVRGRVQIDLNYGGASWSGYQLLVQSANTSTSSNVSVGMAFHNRRYLIAPVLRNYGPYGETLDFTNNPGTAFITIRASAFQVNSTIRVKDDIRAVEDADAIKMAEDFLLVSYTPKVRPQTMRPNERFNRIDAKWQESGRPPLTPQSAYADSHDHDCSIDNCAGSIGNECPITVNDSRVYSGLAEWTGETNPEIAFFDEGGIAEGLDVAQIASSALGAAGSLSRKLTAAMETIDSLQSRLAALEAKQ